MLKSTIFLFFVYIFSTLYTFIIIYNLFQHKSFYLIIYFTNYIETLNPSEKLFKTILLKY